MVRCIEKLREYEDNASVSALLLVGKTELSPVLVVGKTEWGFGVLLIFLYRGLSAGFDFLKPFFFPYG